MADYRAIAWDFATRIDTEIADTDTLNAGNIAPQTGILTLGGSGGSPDVYIANGHDFQVWGIGAEFRVDGGADALIQGSGSFQVPAVGTHRIYGGTFSMEVPTSLSDTLTLVNGQLITTSNNGNITLDPHGSGVVDFGSDFFATGHNLGNAANRAGTLYATALDLPTTFSSTVGVLSFSTTPAFHVYGTNNLFGGLSSGNFTLTGSSNTGLGENALSSLTSGSSNVAIGHDAMLNATVAAECVAIGHEACSVVASTSRNTAVGHQALRDGTPVDCVALGYNALVANNSGARNVAVGLRAANNLVAGSDNVAVGTRALNGATGGSNNIAIGTNSMNDLGAALTGSQNVCVGSGTGFSLTGASSGNVFIGHDAGGNETGSNKLYIANNNTATPLIGGDFSVPSVDVNGSLDVLNDVNTQNGLYNIGGERANDAICAYDSTGGQTFTTLTAINLDSTSVSGNLYTLVSNIIITISTAGRYLISYEISLTLAFGTARTSSVSSLWYNPGGGFAEVTQTRAYGYHRNSANGYNTVGATVVLDIAAGGQLVLGSNRLAGTGVLSTIANGTRITIQRLS